MALSKPQFRRQYRTLRNRLERRVHSELCRCVYKLVTQWPPYLEARTVMTYLSVRNEVDTLHLAGDILARGKRLAVPRIEPADHSMVASQILEPRADLALGHYGLLEPPVERLRPLPPDEIDLFLVPGVVWNSRGLRLGYGGGYYDRYLKLPGVQDGPPGRVVGLAFELQIDDSIPEDSWDVPVDVLITERRIIGCRKARNRAAPDSGVAY